MDELILNLSLPNKFLLPRNKAESKNLGSRLYEMAGKKELSKRYSIFQQNLARLKRDYQGMILYRKLLQENND